jgi:hypothetical protein
MSYLSDHQRVHSFFVNEFGGLVTSTPVVEEQEETQIEEHEEYAYYEEAERPIFGVTFL